MYKRQSYDSLKQQWKAILANGPTSPVEMQEEEEVPQQVTNAGDERFETDIYKRIMDRKFRIGNYLIFLISNNIQI